MDTDPLAPLHAYAKAGHSVREIARLADVPHKTVDNWLKRGTPLALIQAAKVLAALKKLRRARDRK